MVRCQHCGEEIDEGKQFCPYCGKPADVVVESHQVPVGDEESLLVNAPQTAGAAAVVKSRSQVESFASFEKTSDPDDKSRRNVFAGIAVVTLLLIGGLVWWASRPAARTAEPRLEGALRPGSQEFDQIRERIIVDFDPDERALVNERALGDVVINLRPVIRNFTGRTITGLELKAIAVDLANQPVKERTVVPIPNQLSELEPNKTFSPSILLEGIRQDNRPANLRIELTGVRFK